MKREDLWRECFLAVLSEAGSAALAETSPVWVAKRAARIADEALKQAAARWDLEGTHPKKQADASSDR